MRIYITIIKPALMYGCETWSLLQNAENKLGAFEKKILRRIYGPIHENGKWRCRYNTELYELYKNIDIVNDVELRLQWAGHVIRMPEEMIPWKVMMGRLEGVRPIGRPRKQWMNGCPDRCEGITESEELENAGAGQERMEAHNWEGQGPI
jgi:hypothetical protein